MEIEPRKKLQHISFLLLEQLQGSAERTFPGCVNARVKKNAWVANAQPFSPDGKCVTELSKVYLPDPVGVL